MVKKTDPRLIHQMGKNTIVFPNPVFGNLVISRQNPVEYNLSICPKINVTQSFCQSEQNIKMKHPFDQVSEAVKKDNKKIVRQLEKIAKTVQKNEQKKVKMKTEKEKKALEKKSIECFNSNFNVILYEIIRAKAEERLVKKIDQQKSDGSRYELYEINLDDSKMKETNVDKLDNDSRSNGDDRSLSSRRGETTPRSQCSTQSFEWHYETVEYDGSGNQHRKVSELVDKLLYEIYGNTDNTERRGSEYLTRSSRTSGNEDTDSSGNVFGQNYEFRRSVLATKSNNELRVLLGSLKTEIHTEGNRLIRQLKRRETQIARQEADSNMVTALLQAHSEKRSEDTRMKFSVCPSPGESGYEQWLSAMKMVARLAGGIPQEFRKTLWLTLAEKHLISRGVDWAQAEKLCFNEWSNPDDEELGVQIVKDLHRTGCSLFCGASGQQNQAVLKRVLLGYARWNKVVGYCQGFNMLAALILQVMDRNEVDSVKVMIYLIEGVLPESYFANSLRGLSVDMAVFRDLLRVKLPSLSRHLEQLQNDSKDSGTSYEPPLTNVFTMQWFLTLFSNCLPQTTVLRVWDLIFLEGNAILLQTALAIWNSLSDRIMMVESADEFYSIMGVLTREMLEFGTIDANNLIKDITTMNLPELTEMRERYLYNITPWTQVARKGLRLFYAEDEVEDTDEEDDKVANIATAYGFFKSRKSDSSLSRPMSPSRVSSYPTLSEDREKIALDISALKKQYCKLRERQRQAHVIFNAAYEGVVNLSQTASTPAPNTAPTVNHLLQGKNAILSMKGKRPGPPPGSIPPSLRPRRQERTKDSGETIHWKDEPKLKSRKSVVASCSSDTILSEVSNTTQDSLSGTDSISSSSSSSTELCDDESDRMSDFDSDVGHNEKQVPLLLDEKIPELIDVLSPESVAPLDEKIPELNDVLSPESVDNALCCDNTQASANSSVSVSPIELDDTTVPCDKSVLSVRELELSNLETIVNKTETHELTLNVDNDSIGNPSEIHGSRSPQMENVSHNTEALIDLGKKLDQLKSTNSDTTQDNQTEESNNLQGSIRSNDCFINTEADTASCIDNRPDKDPSIIASEEVDIKTNDTDIVKNNTSILDNNEEPTEVASKDRSSERKSSSDLALLKILNENSEILNRIQTRRNSLTMLEEVNSELKPWKTFDKQKSLDICPTRYEKQNIKWFSSSVDFSSMKLGSISSRSSFETIDETKELKIVESEDDVITDVYNQQYSDRNKDKPQIEKTKFGIPKIAEESDPSENVPENTNSKPDGFVQKKTSKIPFNPFPSKITTRQNKELGIKLGLYSSNECNKNKS